MFFFLKTRNSSPSLTDKTDGSESLAVILKFTFKCWAQHLHHFTSCELQAKSLNLSEPQFPSLISGDTGPSSWDHDRIKSEQMLGTCHVLALQEGKVRGRRGRVAYVSGSLCVSKRCENRDITHPKALEHSGKFQVTRNLCLCMRAKTLRPPV